ncbi:hypothetical protein ACVWZZ_002068 [Bradyrhizobium sp. LM6.10]
MRTTLSMAAMWSASTAWRRPNTHASSAVAITVGRSPNAAKAQTHAATLAAINPPNSSTIPGSTARKDHLVTTINPSAARPSHGRYDLFIRWSY